MLWPYLHAISVILMALGFFLCPFRLSSVLSSADLEKQAFIHPYLGYICWCCLGCHSLLQPRWQWSPPSTAEVSPACLDSRRGDGGRSEDYDGNRSETWGELRKPVEKHQSIFEHFWCCWTADSIKHLLKSSLDDIALICVIFSQFTLPFIQQCRHNRTLAVF